MNPFWFHRFPGKVSTSESGKALEETADRLREAKALYEGTRLEDTEETLYNTLLNTFKEGVPSEPEIDRMIDDAQECARLRSITEKHALSDTERDKLSRYNSIYADPHTLEANVNNALNDWNDRSRMLNEACFLERDFYKTLSSVSLFFRNSILILSMLNKVLPKDILSPIFIRIRNLKENLVMPKTIM